MKTEQARQGAGAVPGLLLQLSDKEITSIIGLAFHVTVPGEGVVLLDAGRLLYDAKGHLVFEAGLHQILGSNADTKKLRGALA